MKKILLCLACVSQVRTAPVCEAGLKIYYVRHAETGVNVAHEWKDVPQEQWPDYVGKKTRFSPKGEEQVRALPQKLSAFRFDFIAVSPTERTRNTILPYLKANNLKAEIWPELRELGSREADFKLIGKPDLPPPSPNLISGRPLQLSEEEARYFTLRKDAPVEVASRSGGAQGAADLTAMLKQIVTKIYTDFGNTDQSILLVGHGRAGHHLLRTLLGGVWKPGESIRNTAVWMVEQQPDGSFKVMIYNDTPLDAKVGEPQEAAAATK